MNVLTNSELFTVSSGSLLRISKNFSFNSLLFDKNLFFYYKCRTFLMQIDHGLCYILFLRHAKNSAMHFLKVFHCFRWFIRCHNYFDSIWKIPRKPKSDIDLLRASLGLFNKMIDPFKNKNYFIVDCLKK